MTLTASETAQVDAANASGKRPVVFVHGLWLLASSWDRWRAAFEADGYATLAPGWPDDPGTVEQARAHPEAFAGKSVGAVAAHYAAVIRKLDARPAVVGHSFGGLITQQLAGRGLAAASVAVDPAPFRGVLPLPVSALRASFPVLSRPGQPQPRSVPHRASSTASRSPTRSTDAEARELYATYPVPGAGLPLFEAAFANLNPRSARRRWTVADPARGPLLIIGGARDNTVP